MLREQLSLFFCKPAFELSAPLDEIDEALDLENKLGKAMRERVRIVITDNRRTMLSWDHQKNIRVIRMHRMFLSPDTSMIDTLARFIKRSDTAASRRISAFVEANRHQIRTHVKSPRKFEQRGKYFNLQEIFDNINAKYFANKVDVEITWGRFSSGSVRFRRSIKLGSYEADEKLIRIHPALDQEWVPGFFLEFIVYHEMLHHMVPAVIRNGRTMFHNAEFRRREREFAFYKSALAWEHAHVHKLMHSTRS